MKRALALTLAAALLPATVAAPKAEAVRLRCHPVHVIQAAGTGFSHSWDPSARETLFDDASSPADDLQRRFGARTVSTYTVKYPASLGRFSALGSAGNGLEGTEAATYGESVRYGRDVATLEMETMARHCPGTRFIFIGYSQGAHLIGDAAAEAAAGRVRGVGADDIAAVLLFADPARAPVRDPAEPARHSRLYAPAPKGVRGANFETVQTGGTTLDPTRVGLAGTRRTSFNGLEGKVLSLCNGADMACATDPDSVLRAVADVAGRDVLVGPFNAFTGMRVARFQQLRAGGMPPREAAKESGLSLLDATVAPQILYELHLILSAASHHADAASPTPVEQQAAIALAAAAPELAKEGVTWTWMLQGLNGLRGAMCDSPAAAWFDVVLEVFRAAQAVEQMYWWLERFGVVPRTPTGTEGRQVVVRELVAKLSAQAIDAAGLRAAYDHPANANLVASAKLAGDFGPRHMSYYKLGYTDIPGGYSVEGCTGYDYALGWLGEVVEGVAGK